MSLQDEILEFATRRRAIAKLDASEAAFYAETARRKETFQDYKKWHDEQVALANGEELTETEEKITLFDRLKPKGGLKTLFDKFRS